METPFDKKTCVAPATQNVGGDTPRTPSEPDTTHRKKKRTQFTIELP